MYFCLQVPDPKEFYMVADSVEELRILARQFEDPEPLVLRRGKREVVSAHKLTFDIFVFFLTLIQNSVICPNAASKVFSFPNIQLLIPTPNYNFIYKFEQ